MLAGLSTIVIAVGVLIRCPAGMDRGHLEAHTEADRSCAVADVNMPVIVSSRLASLGEQQFDVMSKAAETRYALYDARSPSLGHSRTVSSFE